MKKYQLNPKEELIHSEKSNPKLKIKARNSYVILLGIFLTILGLVLLVPAKNDSILYAPALIALGVGLIFIVLYFVRVSRTSHPTYTYLITNTRVIMLDEQGEEINSIIKARIRSIDIDEIKGKSGDVVINKRELDPARIQKLELKGETGPFYTNDTFVLPELNNAQDFVNQI